MNHCAPPLNQMIEWESLQNEAKSEPVTVLPPQRSISNE